VVAESMPRSSMWRAKQVSLSKVTDARILGSGRRKAAIIAAMVSPAVLPARRDIKPASTGAFPSTAVR
jgi:hypothetical protein